MNVSVKTVGRGLKRIDDRLLAERAPTVRHSVGASGAGASHVLESSSLPSLTPRLVWVQSRTLRPHTGIRTHDASVPMQRCENCQRS